MVMDTAPRRRSRDRRLGASIVRASYDECWRTVERHGSDGCAAISSIRSTTIGSSPATARLALEILEDLPDVDAIVAPLGGGGCSSGIAAAVRALQAATRGSTPPSRRPPHRFARRSPRASGLLRGLDARRSWTAPAASPCSTTMWPLLARSPARSSSRSTRWPAMRLDRRARARHRRRRRRLRGRRGAQRTRRAPARSSPSSPAATSTCRRLRRSSAHDTRPQSRIHDPQVYRYASLPPRPHASRASTSSPSISGGAGTRGARRLPPSRLRALARDGAQPGADAVADPAREARGGRARSRVPARSTTARSRRSTPRAAARNTWWAQTLPAARAASRSRTSPPSSRCISRCRSTPAASACSPAITARKPATSACRSSASASCIRRATSTSTCRPKAGRKKATSA